MWPEFVDAYLVAALWSSTDEGGHPLDSNFDVEDFSQEAVDQAVVECNDFIQANRADLESVGTREQHGHDFWLNRNGHGTGFWDRGYGVLGTRLSDAAHVYGEINVYAGDDGKLEFMG